MNNGVLSQILDLDNLFINDKFYFGRNYNRGNVLKQGDKYYHGVCLGIIFSWTHGQEYTISGASKQPKYANLLKKSMNLINTFDPEFKCSTIQFNKNYRIAKHLDSNNVGESYIIGLGSYVGGELIVYDKDDNPTYVNINHRFYKFNGSEYYHRVAEFIGERITLVFFYLGEEGFIKKK